MTFICRKLRFCIYFVLLVTILSANGKSSEDKDKSRSNILSAENLLKAVIGGKKEDEKADKKEAENDDEDEDDDSSEDVDSGKDKERRDSKSDSKGPKIWDQWSKWSACSVTCGIGKITRWRHCVSGGCATGEKEAQIKTCTLPAC